jgi:hypothetical protein
MQTFSKSVTGVKSLGHWPTIKQGHEHHTSVPTSSAFSTEQMKLKIKTSKILQVP